MISVEWKKSNLDSFYKKMDHIINNLQESTIKGVNEALESTQRLALQLKRGSNKGILIELADLNTGEIKGRVYTDSKNFPYLVYLEFGTGIYADPEGGGTRAKKIPWYVHTSMADLSRYGYELVTYGGESFYVVYGMRPHPYMRPAGFQNIDTSLDIIQKAIVDMIKEAIK